jgi:hypothetical protein
MRGDVMQWVGRLVAAVFGVGVLALGGLVVHLARRAEGVPPMPIFMGILGLVALILLAGTCLALISIAVSLRRWAGAQQPWPAADPATPPVAVSRPEEEAPNRPGSFSPTTLPREAAASPRPVRPNRVLVAER